MLQREQHALRRQQYYTFSGGSLLIAAAILFTQIPWLAFAAVLAALLLLYTGRPTPPSPSRDGR